jgi:hypothetical protein
MDAVNSSETSVNIYQTTRHNIPDDSHLHSRRRENLKSHQHIILTISIDVPEKYKIVAYVTSQGSDDELKSAKHVAQYCKIK